MAWLLPLIKGKAQEPRQLLSSALWGPKRSLSRDTERLCSPQMGSLVEVPALVILSFLWLLNERVTVCKAFRSRKAQYWLSPIWNRKADIVFFFFLVYSIKLKHYDLQYRLKLSSTHLLLLVPASEKNWVLLASPAYLMLCLAPFPALSTPLSAAHSSPASAWAPPAEQGRGPAVRDAPGSWSSSWQRKRQWGQRS